MWEIVGTGVVIAGIQNKENQGLLSAFILRKSRRGDKSIEIFRNTNYLVKTLVIYQQRIYNFCRICKIYKNNTTGFLLACINKGGVFYENHGCKNS